jgi:hypothetical protein
MNNTNGGLKMRFDINTIDHLGIKLYSSFPPVIGELVSNSYDADAEKIIIEIDYSKKELVVSDDGNGMSFDELKNAYLVIGRNRRTADGVDVSPVKKRPVTGKKGLGKLAVFGVANTITVSSVKDGLKNAFVMSYSDIKNASNSEYRPKIIEQEVNTTDHHGTKISITDIQQQHLPSMDSLVISLSKRFKFFDENDLCVVIKDANSGDVRRITNSDYYDQQNNQFSWTFPDQFREKITTNVQLQTLARAGVEGKIFTSHTPLQKKFEGFVVYSRGKLAQESGFFSDRANDNFYRYAYGFLSIDLIDQEASIDYVGTDRRSILWEQSSKLASLREALNTLLALVQKEWRIKRADAKTSKIRATLPELFYDDVPSETDKRALKSIESSLINNSPDDEDSDRIIELMKAVKTQFSFDSFKKTVIEMNQAEITVEQMEKLSGDWLNIETQELAKVATGRIQTIDKFEAFINSNYSETKFIQPFLEKFPWILEPRMTSFDREVHFSTILKQRFPDDTLDEPNRRLDFLCSDVNGDIYIIELKRPNIKIGQKEIWQALSYRSFLMKKRPELKEHQIHVYLISNNFTYDREAEDAYSSFEKDGKLTIRSYTEMLEQARRYHDNFIDAQHQIEQAKKSVGVPR